MKKSGFFLKAAVCCLFMFSCGRAGGEAEMIKLPDPVLKGEMSLEETIQKRRSIRRYEKKDLSDAQISNLLWSAQGITEERRGYRSAPSAGAIFPMTVYLADSRGLFKYIPKTHSLEKVSPGDKRPELQRAALGQGFVSVAAISIIICADYPKLQNRYGGRAVRYADMEAGHIAQNIHLQAVALGLGSVPVGAFNTDEMRKIINVPRSEEPIYMVPVGHGM